MNKIILILIIALVLALAAVYFIMSSRDEDNPLELNVQLMKITSPVFENNQTIPKKYTCDGDNISPPLNISDAPAEAETLVLVCDDPDAGAKPWVHWTVWNIDPATAEIAEGAVPKGAVQGKTSFGETGYGGPCPPSGEHHYLFKVYALDKILDELEPGAVKSELDLAMEDHIVARGELAGVYRRNK